MQDIYFRGRQPIPELLRIELMTDHLAETLRLHPPENLRGDVYLYVATPQGTRDVARLLPDEKVAENDYFSIASETASDYRWNNTKIKFVGFVTVEV